MKSLSSQFAGSLSAALKRCSSYRAVLFTTLLLVFATSVWAQEATIVGTVTDPSGATVTNAKVTVTNLDTNISKDFMTNDSGQYVAVDVHIGHYNIKVEMSGFKGAERKGLVLQVGDRARVDFQLAVGGSAETVTVEANTIAVQADSGEVSNVITGEQIANLSINGRGIYQLAALAPGASSQIDVNAPNTPVGGSASVEFNGLRQNHNIYLLDGGENDDRGGAGGMSIAPSVDAIAEFRQLTSNYSADYGLSSAGTMTLVLKSGTQTIHASAWEFNRNDAFDAQTDFNAASKLRVNQFGFNVGGPVTLGKLYNADRKKTFFFYNMEWRKYINGGSVNQTEPPTSEYGGVFASSFTVSQLHTPCTNQVSAAVATAFANAGQTLSTPAADGSCSGAGLQAFTNNTIPTSLLDPNAQALLTAGGKYGGIFPAPTVGANFVGGNSLPTNVREEIVRIDENVSPKLSVFGHLVAEQVSQDYGTTIFSGDNVPTVGNKFLSPSYAAVAHATYIFSPTLVNEISFNYNGNRIDLLPIGLFSAPADFTFHRFFDGPNIDNRIPSIFLLGSTGTIYTSLILPWHNFAHSYQLRDDVSWTRGRHQLKIGGSWLFFAKAQNSFTTTQGGFVFTGQFTGNDFADYLLGYATNYQESAVQNFNHWNSNSFALYFQDNYRVNRRLTVNLGLRWDGVPHTYDANKQTANFYPNLYDPADAAQLGPDFQTVLSTSPGLGTSPNPILAGQQFYLNGVRICGVDGTPHGCVKGNWKNFGPRVGFAYDLTGAGKTVIRGGYGIMYERLQGNDLYNLSSNVPFTAGVNFVNVSLSNPGSSVATGEQLPSAIPVTGLVAMDPAHYSAPRSTQFSFGVQRAIGTSVLSAAYVGSRNRHQNFYSQLELPSQSLLPGFVNSSTLAQTYNASVPYAGYNTIQMGQDEANGKYDSFQLSFRGTTLRGALVYQVGYTYSQSYDSFTDFAGGGGGDLSNVSNPYLGWKYDYGPSAFDIRNNFFADFVYRIPFLNQSSNRWLKAALGGWEVSGIVSAASGAPLSIGVTGQNVTSVIQNTLNRPNLSGHMSNPHTVNEWFDTSVFSLPAPGTWGNTPANNVSGPGHDNWNLSFFKNFVLSQERLINLQFRAEFFNVWNHTQWIGDTQNGGIITNFGASNFGAVTSAADPRTIQLALKFSF